LLETFSERAWNEDEPVAEHVAGHVDDVLGQGVSRPGTNARARPVGMRLIDARGLPPYVMNRSSSGIP
jgi:hypothetical protein